MSKYLRINRIAKIYIVGVIFLNLQHKTLSTTYAIIPINIPSEIEYVKGIAMMHMKAGIDSV